MGTLYRYEMKKVLSQKVFWVALGIMLLLLFGVGITDMITGNATKAARYKQISGREIDDTLIEEMQNTDQKDTYQVIRSFVTYCMGREDYGTVNAGQVYESRDAYNKKEMEAAGLSEEEKSYWQERESAVKKPLTYQYEEGYAGLFSSVYVANYILLILTAFGVSGIFADEKSRGTDQLIFSSAGREKLFGAKALAAFSMGMGLALLLFGVIAALSFGTYGFSGFGAPLQLRVTGCMLDITIGEAVLVMFGLFVAAGILYSMLALFLSQVLGNHPAATAVMVILLFLSMINIPDKVRLLSQAWRFLPGAYIGSWTFTEYRLVKIFGHFFNNIQVAPVLWLIAAVAALLFTKVSYKHYQVLGR